MRYKPEIVLSYFREMKLPYCVPEWHFHPTRKWSFDFAFPDQKIALEVEGGVWHGGRHCRGSGFVKDMEKYNEATCMGWRLIRCQPDDVCTMETIDLLKRVML